MIEMIDAVKCPHCGEVTDIGGLVGPNTNDCPKCGKPALVQDPQPATPATPTQPTPSTNPGRILCEQFYH